MPMVISFQAAMPHSDAIKRPKCSECGAAAELFGIEPERPGYELHTFVCPQCEHIETAVGPVASGSAESPRSLN